MLTIAGGIIIAVVVILVGLYLAARYETAFLLFKLVGLLAVLGASGLILWAVLAR